MTGFLMIGSEILGQKTTIDLLPYTHQRSHPQVTTDNNFANDSSQTIESEATPSSFTNRDNEKNRISRKENKRTGFQIDSIFQKNERKKSRTVKSSRNSLLNFKNFNPIKFIVYITALNI